MEIILETVSTTDLIAILDDAKISYEVGDDEDIRLMADYHFYIKIDKKHDALRFFGWMKPEEYNGDELTKAINMLNTGSNTVKYSSIINDEVFFEYGILLSGKIDSSHFLKTLEHIKEKASVLTLLINIIIKNQKKRNEK